MAFFDSNEGQCENCEEFCEENELEQCHLGFCAKFLCNNCAEACSTCKNGHVAGSSIMVFCLSCANKVVPKCFNCKMRFCGRCTSFTKCKLCSNVICSECVFNGSTQLLQGGYCRLCDEVQRINSLQILCRNAVRKYIACNLTCGHGNESRNSSPTAHINRAIDQLSLPKIVREIMKLHP